MIKMVINGTMVEAKETETILEAARRYNMYIPSLCYHEALDTNAACRLCMVEIGMEEWGDWKGTVASCAYPVKDKLIVETDSDNIRNIRRHVMELLLARCPNSPGLKNIAHKLGIYSTRYRLETREKNYQNQNCIMCGLCTRTCATLGNHAISTVNRGLDKEVAPPLREPPKDCTGCLACAKICPTNAIVFDEVAGVSRTIWNKTFQFIKCNQCGKGFMTKEEALRLKASKGIDTLETPTCYNCKQNNTVKTFNNVLSMETTNG